jgi:hypothetical protein
MQTLTPKNIGVVKSDFVVMPIPVGSNPEPLMICNKTNVIFVDTKGNHEKIIYLQDEDDVKLAISYLHQHYNNIQNQWFNQANKLLAQRIS